MAYRHPNPAIERLIAEARIATLGTNGPHGPHLAPVWFEYEDGEFRFITPARSQKAANLDRDPRVGISIEAANPTRVVMANGTATVEPLTDLAVLARLAARAYDSAEQGKAFAEEAPKHERIVIRVRPTHWTTYGAMDGDGG
jgi:PPOX class probable F420-dependent enzyme